MSGGSPQVGQTWLSTHLLTLSLRDSVNFKNPLMMMQVWGAQAVEYWLVDDRGPQHLGSVEVPVDKSKVL